MREIEIRDGISAVVDDEDYERLKCHTWRLLKRGKDRFGYAFTAIRANGKFKDFGMHHLVIECPKGSVVDHINGNSLDNRRCNLRIATRGQNAYSRRKYRNGTNKYKGVTWDRKSKKWRVRVWKDKVVHQIGLFDCDLEGARAYNEAAVLYHGEFAVLNELPA